MSEKNLVNYIKRLRLKVGDILVVRDLRTAIALVDAGKLIKVNLDIPIIIAPQGVKKVTMQQLKDIVARNIVGRIEAKS